MRDLPSGFQTGPPRSQFMVGRKGNETTPFSASVSSIGSPVIGGHNISQNVSPVVPSATPVPQESSSQPDLFGTQMDDGGLVEDFIPPVDVDINDVHIVDEGTPVTTLSSQENAAVLSLPSWNVLVGVSRCLIPFSRLTSHSFMISC